MLLLMTKNFNTLATYLFIALLHIPFVSANLKGTDLKGTPGVKLKFSAAGNTHLKANDHYEIFDSLKLHRSGLSKQAFGYAVKGFEYLRSTGRLRNDKVISIVDFSLHSSKKRLFILDSRTYRILFNTHVAHGRNSGKDFAKQFSNEYESYKSSLGFYITQNTYIGSHGYSLRLHGEEAGINDNAINRAIVMHSAWYVNENMAKRMGYIGRSEGCPAIPEKLNKPIIEKIKNGSCLFLYSPNRYYISHSEILQKAQAA